MPSPGAQALRCNTPVVSASSTSQSCAVVGCILFSTPQARSATRLALALGARTRAAVMAASRASSPCGALSNKVRLSASMPCISPRNGTRFKYASKIWSLRQLASKKVAETACPVLPNIPLRSLPLLLLRGPSSTKLASCMLSVDAPRVFWFSTLPQAAADTAFQSTPLCS